MMNEKANDNKLDLMEILREANEGNPKIESITEAYLEKERSNVTLYVRFMENVNKQERAAIAAEVGSMIMKILVNNSMPMLKVKILN